MFFAALGIVAPAEGVGKIKGELSARQIELEFSLTPGHYFYCNWPCPVRRLGQFGFCCLRVSEFSHLPQTLPAAIHRDQAIFADLEHRPVTRGGKGGGGTSPFDGPVEGLFGGIVVENCAEGQ